MLPSNSRTDRLVGSVELQKEFRMNLNAIEKEKSMPYVTSVERLAREDVDRKGNRKGDRKA